MTSIPTVSVVMPTWNGQDFVSDAIESVLNQSERNIELIVVDDASVDATMQIVSTYALKDSRISWRVLGCNSQRPAVPRNVGVAMARAPYVAFIDQDDTWSRSKVDRQLQAMREHPEIAMVHSMFRIHPENRSGLWKSLSMPQVFEGMNTYSTLLQGNVITCSSVMLRVDAFHECGGFDEDIDVRTVEDYLLWLNISQRFKVGYVVEQHGMHRLHASSTSSAAETVRRLNRVWSQKSHSIALPSSRNALTIQKLVGSANSLWQHLVLGEIRRRTNRSPKVVL